MKRLGASVAVISVATGVAVALAALTGGESLSPSPPTVVINKPVNMVGSAAEDMTYVGGPSGSVTVTALDGGGCTDATVTPVGGSTIPQTLASGQVLHLNAQCFAQSQPTLRRCRFVAQDGAGLPLGHFTVACPVFSGGTTIGVQPMYDFGSVPVNQTAMGVIQFAPTEALSAFSVYSLDNDDVIGVSQPCPPGLGPGCHDVPVNYPANVSQGLMLTCTPRVPGKMTTAQVMMVGNTNAHGGLTVTCTAGAAAVAISASPTSVSLTTAPNTTASQSVTITNTGTSSVSLDGATISPPTTPWTGAFGPGCPGGRCTLAPNATTTYSVAFAPTAAGSFPAQATVRTLDGATTTIMLDGTAPSATVGPVINVTPTNVYRTYSGTPTPDVVTVANVGDAPLVLNGYMWGGDEEWNHFTWDPMCIGLSCTLAPNTSTTFSATYQPTGPGTHVFSMAIASNDPMIYANVSFTGDAMGVLSVSPDHRDVTTTVGMSSPPQVVRIQNTSLVPVTLDGASTGGTYWSFQWDAMCPGGSCTLAAGQEITLSGTFTPLAPGDEVTTIAFNSNAMNAPHMATFSGHAMASSSGQLDITTRDVQLTTAVGSPRTSELVVTNIGGGPLTITGHAMDSVPAWTSVWTSCDPGCTLMPGEAFAFDVRFLPTTIVDMLTSQLRIASDDPNSRTTIVNLVGRGEGSTLELATNLGMPPTIAFGDLPVNVTSTPVTITLRNTGNIATDEIALNAPGEYAVSPNLLSIPPHSTQDVTIACTPSAIGNFDGTLTAAPLRAQVLTIPDPFQIALRCRGTDVQLVVSPSPIQLGEVRVGTTKSVTVTLSTVRDPLTVTARSLTGANGQLSLGSLDHPDIADGSPAHFDVIVNASSDDDLADTLTVTATDTQTVAITGSVVTPAIDYPRDLDLGTFCIGRAPAPQTLAFRATGTATIAMPVAPKLETGGAFSLTTVAPAEYPTDVPKGGAATVELAALGQNVAGDHADRIVWSSDMPDAETAYTNVAAHFVDRGGAISPQSISFGSVIVRQRSEVHTITLENCDAQPIALQPPAIDSPAFAIEGDLPPTSLAPMETATFAVVFQPDRVGPSAGTLLVDSSQGPLRVQLTGLGLGANDGNGDKTGFYACDCQTTDPAAGGPIVLALFAIVRRRKR